MWKNSYFYTFFCLYYYFSTLIVFKSCDYNDHAIQKWTKYVDHKKKKQKKIMKITIVQILKKNFPTGIFKNKQ